MNTSNEHEAPDLLGVFEERAEYLTKKALYTWTVTTKRDQLLLKKLKGPGAKLLTGPRGSGKSTMLKRAYYDLLTNQTALGVYVNYSRSLALEPLFHKTGNAAQLFRQWVLAKIIEGVAETFSDLDETVPHSLSTALESSRELIEALEAGRALEQTDLSRTPSLLIRLLSDWLSTLDRNRVVLLFDDAAHAFSLEQQRDFFEIFRELRSRNISAKAAIYPGITSYSPNFHVGHEAELLEIWYEPDSEAYLGFMWEIFKKRIPDVLRTEFEDREDLVDLVALAANGLPRGFLNMLSDMLLMDDANIAKPTRSSAMSAIADHAETVRGVYTSLSSKLPRFRHFIEVGKELESSITSTLQTYNRNKPLPKKAVTVAIAEPVSLELERILNFFQYAGLLRKKPSVSRGVKGVFQRYDVHNAIVVTENSLSLGKSYSVAELVDSLSKRDAHAFVRTRASSLLGSDYIDRCVLDLPPCDSCQAPRVKEEQRFCMNCGAELSDASVYQELINASIDELPLTDRRLSSIKSHTSIRKIQDILADDDLSIRKVPYVGEIWARRIRTYAEEFVSV
ncbi:AAA family ATPase [Salinisphaera sp. LB1]|uniref:AAA family ATPase n=1 Tax=Salinisphaera sp. LB1 TaxID=2183911 RepID=UPI000D7063B1|nr:AAA family ATPase [Salinisphaera sp. LB1]AWN17254.1 hypothetical protein SALB1_3060 [Salinisphaera sp. LB1]